MTTPNVTISISPIHGKGLFAARDFDAGEKILSWAECAEILSDQDARDLPPYEQKFLLALSIIPVIQIFLVRRDMMSQSDPSRKAMNSTRIMF